MLRISGKWDIMDIYGWKFIILTVTISRTSTSDLTTHDIDTVT
jgi:hypothetical protein